MEEVNVKKAAGNTAYSQRNFSAAVEHYSGALDALNKVDDSEKEKKSTATVLLANRAAALLGLKKYEDVLQDCRKCLENDPNYIKAHLRQATALECLGRYEEAMNCAKVGSEIAKSSSGQSKKESGLSEFKKLQNRLKQKIEIEHDKQIKQQKSLPQNQRALSAEDSKAIKELQENMQNYLLKAEKAKKNKIMYENDLKRTELTLQQLNKVENLSTDRESYYAVGRMFLKKDPSWILNKLKSELERFKSDAEKANREQEFYDKKIRAAETNIREIISG